MFLVFIARSSLTSSNPSSSLSNSSAAVSSKSEDSEFSTQLLSKLSAATASLASLVSSMATPQHTASAQFLQASLAALQELNTRQDIPVIRNARSAVQSPRLSDEFRRVIEGVQDSEHQREESLMRVMLKWVSSSGQMDWNHHPEDIKHFLEQLNISQGSMGDVIHDERNRKYLVISEAEWTSLRVCGWLRSSRASENGVAPSSVQVMMFSALSDAVSHYVYFKVAHSLAHCTKSDQAGGKHVIVSGAMCNKVDETPWLNGFRAGIHHIMMALDQDDGGQVHYSKLLTHEFLKHWSIQWKCVRLHESTCIVS